MAVGESSTTEESAWRLVDLLRLRYYLKLAAAEAVDETSYVAVLQEELQSGRVLASWSAIHLGKDEEDDLSMAQKIW